MNGDKNKDILEEIRDKLGELPTRLAEELRIGRQTRFAGSSRKGDAHGRYLPAGEESESPDRWRATERLLGASGLPIFAQIAEAMGQARRLDEAWTRFVEAWKPSPFMQTTTPLAGPSEAQRLPFAEPVPTLGVKEENYRPTESPQIPTVQAPLPQGYGTLPDDWRQSFRKENEILLDDDEMAEFRRMMAEMRGDKPIPFAPESKSTTPPISSTPLPEPYSLKPEDWRPQPFEILPEERWQPAPDMPAPTWMSQKPEIGFGPEWKPEEQPDIKSLREASASEPTAPPTEGMVRFYHGGIPYTPGDGGRDVSQYKDYAQGYVGKNKDLGKTLQYVDIPETHPILEGKKSFDDEGTDQTSPYVNFKLTEELACQLRPFVEATPVREASEWPTPEKPDLKPLRETPEGWRDVQPLLPLTARQGWQQTMAGEAESNDERNLGEKLDKVVEKLDELISATENATNEENGPPSEDERERGSRQSMWRQTEHEREVVERREDRPRRVSIEGRQPRIPAREESGTDALAKKAIELARKAVGK